MSTPASLRSIARLSDDREVGAWMLTADLAEWDVDELTALGDDVENWRFDNPNERIALMKAGDPCVLWAYGTADGQKVAGLWAIGEITSAPWEARDGDAGEDDDAAEADEAEADEDDDWDERDVYVDIDLQFFADPIPRTVLQADKRFGKAVILHRPDTAAPLPLTPGEYAFIEEYLDANGLWPDDPESDAVLDDAEAAAIAHLESLGMTVEQRDEPPYLIATKDGDEAEVLIAPTTSADEFVLGAAEFDDLSGEDEGSLLVVVVFGEDTDEPRVAHVIDAWHPSADRYDRATQIHRV